MIDKVFSSVYRIGSPCGDNYGYLVLKRDGRIMYSHSINESTWEYTSGNLRLKNEEGVITSEYRYIEDYNTWIGNHYLKLYPMYLMPVLQYCLGAPVVHNNSVVINCIPKSGTHLMHKLMLEIGYADAMVMLTGVDTVDDFQYEDIRILGSASGSRGRICPLPAAVSALPSGYVIVGHIASRECYTAAHISQIKILNCVRNLRDTLISLYRWKLNRRTDDLDLSEFFLFLKYEARPDLDLIKSCVVNILDNWVGPLFRYEDMMDESRTSEISMLLSGVLSVHEGIIKDAIERSRNAITHTYNVKHSCFTDFWDSKIETLFEGIGFSVLNEALGYE